MGDDIPFGMTETLGPTGIFSCLKKTEWNPQGLTLYATQLFLLVLDSLLWKLGEHSDGHEDRERDDEEVNYGLYEVTAFSFFLQ